MVFKRPTSVRVIITEALSGLPSCGAVRDLSNDCWWAA